MLYNLENLDIPYKVSKVVDKLVTDTVDWAIQAPLRDRFRDLPEADMKEILHHRMWESNSYQAHEDHKMLYEALEKSMARDHTDQLLTDLAEARRKKKKRHASPKTPPRSPPHQPPPHPPPAGSSGTPRASGAYGSSSKIAASAEYMAWTTIDTRLKSFVLSIPEELHMDDDTTLDEQVQSSSDEDIGHDHIPTVNLRYALSISKMKAAYYPDVGLEQMVPDQMWIKKECKYDIAAIAVRTHMRILSVVRIEVFSLYGYDYMKKIVLHRADLKEYTIAERDFKYLYPSDFEDLYLLNLQGHLDHLPPEDKKILTTAVNLWTRNLVIRQRVEDFQLGIESYQTQLNLTKPRWDATGFEFKHDFTVIDSPRAVTFRDKYGVQMIMRFNEIHKFSDGTLQQIDEALDYRVKEFKVNRMNPGLNTRFWTRKDVDRSKEFMFAIQKRLKTRRIFRNLESFVGGRIREGDYRLLKRTE
ncbi:hypothetical protein Tco_0517444 [Tanacetum coccineum]